jgi:hypothetical protein
MQVEASGNTLRAHILSLYAENKLPIYRITD